MSLGQGWAIIFACATLRKPRLAEGCTFLWK